MAHATPVLEIIPSSSIECDDGRTPELAAAYKDPIDNANGPDGVVIADGDGEVHARYFPSSDVAADINAVVPAAGELMWKTDTLQAVMGDGTLYGGVPLNLNSQSCIFVAADGSADKNGQALKDAITAAASRTPYGSALSATNPILVVLGPGSYSLTGLSGNIALPNFVGLHGLCGSHATFVTMDNSHKLQLLQPSDTTYYNYLKGITFKGSAANILWTFGAGSANPIVVAHEDLNFPDLSSSTSTMGFSSLSPFENPTVAGYATNVRTTGQALYGRHTTAPNGNLTWAVTFTDCRGGNRSFGGSSGTLGQRSGKLTGGLYNCSTFGTDVWDCILDCPMVNCEWSFAIERLSTGAYLRDTIIRGIASTYSLSHSGAVDIKLRNNSFAGLIHSNVTNLTTGTLDGAGNLVGDSDV
jgi:hypothetical protein